MVGKKNLAGRSSVLYRDSLTLEMNASESLLGSGSLPNLRVYCFPSCSRHSSMTVSSLTQICGIHSLLRASGPLCSLFPSHKRLLNWLTLSFESLHQTTPGTYYLQSTSFLPAPLSLCFIFFMALTILDIASYSFDYMKEAPIKAKMTKWEFYGRHMHSYNVTLFCVLRNIFSKY